MHGLLKPANDRSSGDPEGSLYKRIRLCKIKWMGFWIHLWSSR